MTEVTSQEAPPELFKSDAVKLVDQDEMLKRFWAERPKLVESYRGFISSTSPLVRKSMTLAYTAGLDDAMKFIARRIKKDGFINEATPKDL